jgi:hypothetical protein
VKDHAIPMVVKICCVFVGNAFLLVGVDAPIDSEKDIWVYIWTFYERSQSFVKK